MLKITSNVEKKKAMLTLEGSVDTSSAREFDNVIMQLLDSVDEIVIDCKDLEYISSAGLRVIMAALQSKTKDDWFKMVHVNEPVMEVLDMTGFTELLVIE
ncbi:MAG: STAS domain-containing protein [Oribacterium sp.]|nr:STAS domain-containing protein [Oribacterium sp.]